MANKPNSFNSKLSTIPATILSGQVESSIIRTTGSTMTGIIFPAAFDGLAVNFLASVDEGATFQQMFKLNGDVESLPVSINGNGFVDFQAFSRVEIIKILSSAQGADRDLIIITRDYA